MTEKLLHLVEATKLTAEQIAVRTTQIHDDLLRSSQYIDAPNFELIDRQDVESLFELYDNEFFQGQIRAAVGAMPLEFNLSNRMTSAGGTTTRRTHRLTGRHQFKIVVSATILFECFAGDDHRPVAASGVLCRDRVEALQRVMEHELVHLIELLLWDQSSCSKTRFQSITHRFFGHTGYKHQLITPKEKASVKYGIRTGVKVRFRYDGAEHLGIVNRVRQRVTVLVENRDGVRYSNGKYYAKFYVPLEMLTPVE